jgi:hypothetical protein
VPACTPARAEALATAVVEGLAEGSDLRFENRGEVVLKGIGKRRVSALVS